MKVYIGQKLLTNEAVLSVTEANHDLNFIDWNEDDLDEGSLELNLDFDFLFNRKMMILRGSLEVVHSDTGFIFTSNHSKISRDVCILNDRRNPIFHSPGFLPPGIYRLTLKTQSYTFTVKSSGQVYSLFPSLLRLPKDLMRVVAACDNMTIAQIWDMDKNFINDYFWKSLAAHRLTESPDYLNKPVFNILQDLHYLDQNPLASILFFNVDQSLTEDKIFWLSFDKLKEKFLKRGDLFHLLDEGLAMITSAEIDDVGGFIEDNEINNDLQTIFPQITPLPLDLETMDERKQWREKIYLSIFSFLTQEQLCHTLEYIRDHPKRISLGLVKKMLEYVENIYEVKSEKWNIDLTAYSEPEFVDDGDNEDDNIVF